MKIFRRKNKYLSIRGDLRRLNKLIAKATIDLDVALVEELMEEKCRLLSSI
ncbi:hypothetical protein [Sutcliffiella sp. FSL R7-0096]|uniref:hypothetical protein n=1 Tax=Sutcliffiella sp. FSL R7-0096 TaxID=2921670 RepID=UPI00315A2962